MTSSSLGRLAVTVTALEKLRGELDGFPAAGERSKTGAPSTLELLDQWSLRVQREDMAPEAVPSLLDRQARRHDYWAPRVAAIIRAAETQLRARMGQRTTYGAPWYFGPGVTVEDD